MSDERIVPTQHGDARLVMDRSRQPVATLLLSHGAGGGIDAPDLEILAKTLPRHGITVLRLEQPWRYAGKRIAPRPAVLDEGLIGVANKIRPRTPLILGGRSAGARSAARCSRTLGASGCLALAFPLHPPGKPEKSRADELAAVPLPTLVIQGERDPFGAPEEFDTSHELAVVPDADHSFHVPRRGEISREDALAIVVEATLEWVVREVIGNRSDR